MRRHRRLLLAIALAGRRSRGDAAPGRGRARAAGGRDRLRERSRRRRTRVRSTRSRAGGAGAQRHAQPVCRGRGWRRRRRAGRSPSGATAAGPWRLMIAPDGSALRSVASSAGARGAEYPPWPPVFSADGTRLLIPYARASTRSRRGSALAGVRCRPGAAADRRLQRHPAAWSPDGRLLACATPGRPGARSRTRRARALHARPARPRSGRPTARLAVSGGDAHEVLSDDRARRSPRAAGVARAWSPRRARRSRSSARMASCWSGPGAARSPAHRRTRTARAPYWVAFTPDGRDSRSRARSASAQIARSPAARPGASRRSRVGTWSRDGRYAFTVVAGRDGPRSRSAISLGHGARSSRALPYDDQGVEHARLARRRQRGCSTTRSASGLPELWSMRADGGGQRRLDGTGERIGSPPGAPTARSSRTARPVRRPCGTAAASSLADPRGRKLLARRAGADRAGAERRQPELVAGRDDGSPSPTSSGRAASRSWTSTGGRPHAGRGRRRRSPAWSPDGAHDRVRRHSTTVPSGARRRTAPMPAPAAAARSRGKVTALAWSPDGQAAGVQHRRRASSSRTPDGSARRRSAIAARRTPGRPSFSPDGSRIAFAAEPGAVHPYRAIFVVGVDGSGRPAAHDRARTTAATRPGGRRALSRRRARGGTACRAARAACRPRGSGGRSRRPTAQ